MAICPNGHDSASDDFCDICGMSIATPPVTSAGPVPPPAPAGPVAPPATVSEPCPVCGTARSGQFCEACGHNFNAPPPSWSPAPSAPTTPSAPSAPSAPSVPSAMSVPPAAPAPSVAPVPPAAPAPSVATVPPTRVVPASPSAPAVWTAVVSSDRDYYERMRVASGADWAEVPFPAYCAERRFRLAGSQMRIGRRSVSRGVDPEIDLTGPPVDTGISRLHAVLIAGPDGGWAVLDPGSANGTMVNGNEIPPNSPVRLNDGDRINVGAWTAITVHCA
jgi:FHA domain